MKNILVFIVMALVILCSCSDDNSLSTNYFSIENLTNGYIKLWKLEKIEVQGLSLDDEHFTDEYFLFDNLHHGIVVYGENDFSREDTVTIDKFDYEILDNGAKIKLKNLLFGNKSSEIEEFKILKLTNQEFVLDYKTDIFHTGKLSDTKLYFKSEIETKVNADYRNELLTLKNVKLWRWKSISINGGEELQLDCKVDNYYLFATNGLGITIFGNTHCIPGDTINNDIFVWHFTEDSTAIIIDEMHSYWSHPEGRLVINDTMKVLNLTNDEFKFSSYGYLNEERRDVVITLTNYLK